jgi:hypothetical protein
VTRTAIAILLLLSAAAGAQQQPQAPGDDRSETLRARAAGTSGGERARIFLELAQRDIELANSQFDAGSVEQAQSLIRQAVEDASSGANAAIESGNRLKGTEIEMHRLARRLGDIEQSLSVDDRPPVKSAVEKLQDLDRALLERMFRHKTKQKEAEKK